jgi:hypothetical protein
MNDIDAWLYADGPAPKHFQRLLDALRDAPPETPEDNAQLGQRGATAHSPSLDDRPAAPPPAESPSLPVDARDPRPPESRPEEEDT